MRGANYQTSSFTRGDRTGFDPMFPSLFLAVAALLAGGETRYSVSLTEEASLIDKGNLLILQPTFAYRQGDRWQFSTSIAAITSTQDDTHAQARVRETYLGISAGDFDFSGGRRLLRWGTGYAFTATGVLDPPRIATDPTDRLNLNQGRNMLKADWIYAGQDVTLVWANGFGHETTAMRYNVLVAGFDTSVIVAHDRGGPTLAGTNFTRVFGDRIEVHGEFAWNAKAAELIGGKYTTSSGVTVIGEFFAAGPLRYGFVRVNKDRLRELPGWKEWDVAASLITDFTHQTRIAVFDVLRRFGNHFSAYTHAQVPSALVAVGIRFQL